MVNLTKMSVCGKSELCLFDKASPQVVVEKALFCDIHPTTTIDRSGRIEFLISGSGTEYLDLNDTLLYVKLKVTTKDGKPLAKEAVVTPSNYFLNSLFDDVSLSLNNILIEGGNHLYAYKGTIENELNYSEDTKMIQLKAAGYNRNDESRKMEISESKVIEMVGSLRLDFFNQPKYLLPNVDVRVALSRSKNEFSLNVVGPAQPKIEMLDAIMYVRRVQVAPAVHLGHQIGLLTKNAVYPYNRSQVISYAIAKGSLSYFKDNLFQGALPKFTVICFVKQRAFSGIYGGEPFKFEHFNVGSVGLFKDGQSLPYRTVYEPNFGENLYMRDYIISIVQNTEHLDKNYNNGISMTDFKDGHTFFTFNLTPDYCVSQTQKPQDGNLRLDVKFREALAEPINVIVYALFDGEIQITKDRQVICDHK